MQQSLAIVIPTYNEAETIKSHLNYHSASFDYDELIVIDGGSTDGTVREIEAANCEPIRVTLTPGNRARQLSEGVRVSTADYLLLLHADSYLPESFTLQTIFGSDSRWGWFDCRLDGSTLADDLIGRMISLRSALFSSPTGDQALWVKRSLLESIGGIPKIPLMEDVELSRRLRQKESGARLETPVTTSSRRWKQDGYLKTILSMWTLKLAYKSGIDPGWLAQLYYGRTDTSD
jgi:rSAM/selenodomain-associated transferase 2